MWYKKLHQEIKLWLKNNQRRTFKMPIMLIDTPRKPLNETYMDIIGPLEETSHSNKYILTFWQGGNFTLDTFKQVYKFFRIKKVHRTQYHPQSNGFLEKSYKPSMDYLKSFNEKYPYTWHYTYGQRCFFEIIAYIHQLNLHLTTQPFTFL